MLTNTSKVLKKEAAPRQQSTRNQQEENQVCSKHDIMLEIVRD
jgi:hypothetical protein